MARKAVLWFFLLAAFSVSAGPAEKGWGLLLLAHGAHDSQGGHGPSVWNRNVERLARKLEEEVPTEVAFGMADPETIQAALDRLEAKGREKIVAIPVFISSHSPIIGNFRYILGLQPHMARDTQLKHLERVKSKLQIVFGEAMDDHPLISEILLDRALNAGTPPQRTTVILIAHGPNSEENDRLWRADLAVHAKYLRDHGQFRDVRYLTHRNDAPPPIKAEARRALRAAVAQGMLAGDVAVVPVLLSSGGVEDEIRADLQGLRFRFAKPLLPHPNVQRWVEAQLRTLASD